MNRVFSFLLVSLFVFSSCMKDNSAYLPQEKQEVKVDDYEIDDPETGGSEGALSPGIHQVRMLVSHDGTQIERRFKYFMPVSIDRSKPISLIFYFHGSMEAGVDPLESISLSHPLSQLAIRENCIIVFPAGEDTGAAVNWQHTEVHLPFVDAMVDYFADHTPAPDVDRIYTSGHSSGAIFSFALAYQRSEVFAAAVPVSGQMALSAPGTPERAVPIRAFNGINDNTVLHSAALNNIQVWADRIGGYFATDAVKSDTLQIDNYKPYLTTAWRGGKTDIEFFTILDEGHGVNWYFITPLLWEFMDSHPRNAGSSGLYISSELKRFDAMEGQHFVSEIRYSEGATVSIASYPQDWTVTYADNKLTVKAPSDFFAPTTVNRSGEIVLRVAHQGTSTEISLPFSLQAPKTYYEIGDVVYDDDFQPLGVVFWVNPANVKEAKIIALEHTLKRFGAVGKDFFTPSFTDGYANTLALVERNQTLNLGLTAASSAFMYAYEYKAAPGQTSGWYLPAVDELMLLDDHLATVNAAIEANGTALQIISSGTSYHLSSTMVNTGTAAAPLKRFYTFDYHSNPNFHGYYILSANAADDTAGFVSTRPIKKVTKP